MANETKEEPKNAHARNPLLERGSESAYRTAASQVSKLMVRAVAKSSEVAGASDFATMLRNMQTTQEGRGALKLIVGALAPMIPRLRDSAHLQGLAAELQVQGGHDILDGCGDRLTDILSNLAESLASGEKELDKILGALPAPNTVQDRIEVKEPVKEEAKVE